MQHNSGAAPAAPINLSSAKTTRRTGKAVRTLFLLIALAAAAWGLYNGPWVWEWRLSRMPLPGLQQRVGKELDKVDDPKLLYFTGLRLNESSRYTEADPILRRCVGIDPDSSRYRDEWAKALLGSGLTTAAFGELKEFAARHEDSADAHFLLGKFYFTQRSMKRAVEELDKSISRESGKAESWSYMAGAKDALGDLAGGMKACERAIALRPDHAGDHLLYASMLARANKAEEAGREFSKAIDLDPKLHVGHREYAEWLVARRDYVKSESEARKALQLDPKDSQTHLVLARVLAESGKQADAITEYRAAADLDKDDPAAPLALSRLLRSSGDAVGAGKWEQAHLERQRYASERTKLLDEIRVDPNAIEPHKKMARLLGLHGDVAGCVHHHAMAFHLAVDSPRAMIAATNDLCDGGHAVDALPLARRALTIAENNPASHEAMGNVMLGMGQLDLAGLEYNKTAQWWPHRSAALKAKMARAIAERDAHPTPAELVYREARRKEAGRIGPKRMTDEVEKLAKRAVEIDPGDLNHLWYLFSVQMARRENDAAIETGNRILQINKEDGRAHARLAVLLCDKAKSADDLKEIEKHLDAAAGEPQAAATRHYGLGLLALQRKQGPEAVKELNEALKLDPTSDVIYYKLSMAAQLNGDRADADKHMAEFKRRQDQKRREMEVLGDVAQNPNDRRTYEKAISVFEADGLHAQAAAIRAAMARKFGK